MVPLAVSFAGMVITGLAALRFVNVPMFGYGIWMITTMITTTMTMMMMMVARGR